MNGYAVVLDYGMGNVGSVQKALNFLKIDNIVSNRKSEIEKAKYIILPGVGSFKKGMENLYSLGIIDLLTKLVIDEKKPFLGICLGMQLLAALGTEPITCEGLGWIDGTVIKLNSDNKRVPHLGWNEINVINHNSSVIRDFDRLDFYFIHSYHFAVTEETKIAATVTYFEEYVSVIHSENILATQFHPEKSQINGLKLMKRFLDYHA